MGNRTAIRHLVDLLMTVGLLLQMTYFLIGQEIHEWLGAGMLRPATQHRPNGHSKVAWTIWSVFFLVAVGTMAALTFGSDIWFGRPLNITGPYQMANIAVRFYLPLLTIIIPITISSFSKILLKCRKGHEDE